MHALIPTKLFCSDFAAPKFAHSCPGSGDQGLADADSCLELPWRHLRRCGRWPGFNGARACRGPRSDGALPLVHHTPRLPTGSSAASPLRDTRSLPHLALHPPPPRRRHRNISALCVMARACGSRSRAGVPMLCMPWSDTRDCRSCDGSPHALHPPSSCLGPDTLGTLFTNGAPGDDNQILGAFSMVGHRPMCRRQGGFGVWECVGVGVFRE